MRPGRRSRNWRSSGSARRPTMDAEQDQRSRRAAPSRPAIRRRGRGPPRAAETGRISTEIRTRSALLARVSSSSCGSAPISASRATSRSRTLGIGPTSFTPETVLRRPLERWLNAIQLGFAAVEAPTDNYVDALARLSLFADLTHPQLEAIAHSFDEEVFAEGERVLRQGVTGGDFYVILDGEAHGRDRRRGACAPRRRGDFFGEISLLTDEPPTADVIATTVLRCLIIPDTELKAFLLKQPTVMLPDAADRSAAAARRERLERRRRAAVPAGRLRRRRRRQRPRRPADELLPRARSAIPRRRALARRGAGRHVPALPDLPAPDHLDEAGRAVRAGHARVRVVRPQQPPRRRAGAAGARAGASWTAPSTFPPAPRWRPALVAFAERATLAGALRLRLGVDAARRGRASCSTPSRRRVPLPGGRLRDRRDRAVARADSRARARAPHYVDTRTHPSATRAERLHRRQAQLRLRGRAGSPAVGAPNRARLSAAGADRRCSRSRRSASATSRRTTSTSAAAPGATSSTWRSSGSSATRTATASVASGTTWDGELEFEVDDVIAATGFQCAAARPAELGRGDGQRRPDPGADAVLGERLGARDLLRRQR